MANKGSPIERSNKLFGIDLFTTGIIVVPITIVFYFLNSPKGIITSLIYLIFLLFGIWCLFVAKKYWNKKK